MELPGPVISRSKHTTCLKLSRLDSLFDYPILFHVTAMIFRGQIASKLSRSSLQGVAIGRNDPIPARAGRVSGILLGHRGVAPSIFLTPTSYRNYTDRPISRPKAHTGRTTTSPRRKATVKSTGATVPNKTKAESKAKLATKAKTKARAKPKAKRKAKPKAKSKAKPKAKPKKKTSSSKIRGRPPLTEKQIQARKATNARLRIAELKAKALLSRPKYLPDTAFQVILREECNGNSSILQGAKQASDRYKAITPAQLEHYNHIANQNKAANQVAHQKWIDSHTPLEIVEANVARSQLRSKYKKRKLPLLRDERLVTGRKPAYIYFTMERMANEDFKNISLPDRTRLIAKEWNELSESDKQKYRDLGAQDDERFRQESKAVYGIERLIIARTPKAKAAAAA